MLKNKINRAIKFKNLLKPMKTNKIISHMSIILTIWKLINIKKIMRILKFKITFKIRIIIINII